MGAKSECMVSGAIKVIGISNEQIVRDYLGQEAIWDIAFVGDQTDAIHRNRAAIYHTSKSVLNKPGPSVKTPLVLCDPP